MQHKLDCIEPTADTSGSRPSAARPVRACTPSGPRWNGGHALAPDLARHIRELK
jgi:hypothetical protein